MVCGNSPASSNTKSRITPSGGRVVSAPCAICNRNRGVACVTSSNQARKRSGNVASPNTGRKSKKMAEVSTATECDPAQPNLVQRVLWKLELEHALSQAVVESSDELGKMFGSDAVGEHVARELADVAGGLLQRGHVLCQRDRLGQVAQCQSLH